MAPRGGDEADPALPRAGVPGHPTGELRDLSRSPGVLRGLPARADPLRPGDCRGPGRAAGVDASGPGILPVHLVRSLLALLLAAGPRSGPGGVRVPGRGPPRPHPPRGFEAAALPRARNDPRARLSDQDGPVPAR